MFGSTDTSPGFTPIDTPQMGMTPMMGSSPYESPLHSRSHSPNSISLSFGVVGELSRSTRHHIGGGGTMSGGPFVGYQHTADSSRRSSITSNVHHFQNGQIINYAIGDSKSPPPTHHPEINLGGYQPETSERSTHTPTHHMHAQTKSSKTTTGHQSVHTQTDLNRHSHHTTCPSPVSSSSGRTPPLNHRSVMFHLAAGHFLGGGDDSHETSRSTTPPLPVGGMFLATNHPFDHLCAFTEMLAQGIVTSHDIKKKDNQGREYQNCFMGKEAINCLRHKLPKNANQSNDCMALLQQLFQEGFIIEAQSIDELNKQIAAKFAPETSPPIPPTTTTTTISSAKSSPKLASNTLAFKVPSDIGRPAAPPTLVFRKDGLYQLSNLFKTNGSIPSSLGGSAVPSNCSSPLPPGAMSVVGPQWFSNFSGFLGKKRENKGLGNSLALGLGVSTFQKRFFVCSASDAAVLYFKEEPNNNDGGGQVNGDTKRHMPLGFIPFSEILFVDHLQSSSNQLAMQASLSAGLVRSPSKGSNLSRSGSSTPVPSPADEKAGRLFDIVASFRVYHLQADTSMDAMKWVQAIKENVRESYIRRSDRLLGASAQSSLNAGAFGGPTGATLRAPLVRTPRTPDHSRRFWSNVTSSGTNPHTFPGQYLKQVLRDDTREQLNGLYGKPIRSERLSDLRRYFFELNFSISSLDQSSYFDQLCEDFDSDTKIIEFVWNLILRGLNDAETWGPRAFRSIAQKNGQTNTSSSFSGVGGVSPPFPKPYVDTSSSTVLLARYRDSELDDADGGGVGDGGDVPPIHMKRPRRSISCSSLPDFLGRPTLRPHQTKQIHHHVEQEILFMNEEPITSDGEYSRSQSSRRSVSSRGSGTTGGRRGHRHRHRRNHSDLCPLSRTTYTKFHDFDYHLLNKYALYHSAACKMPGVGAVVSSSSSSSSSSGGGSTVPSVPTLLNPTFLYRIFQPYKRIESWLLTDAFLNLILNDEILINEVPLALPLVWLILQWRNHDSDPHTGGGSGGFIDDSHLKKNWLDETIDGEDDGFASSGMTPEEEEAAMALTKEKSKSGFKSVARAHLRVNSFSTMADPLSALRPTPTPANNPLSPPHVHGSTPVVYGSHGQILAGSRGSVAHPMGSPMSSPSTPMLGARSLLSPNSPSLSEYQSSLPPDMSPLSPMTPMHQPELIKASSEGPSASPTHQVHHNMMRVQSVNGVSVRSPPQMSPAGLPIGSSATAPVTPTMSPMTPQTRPHATTGGWGDITQDEPREHSASESEPGAPGRGQSTSTESIEPIPGSHMAMPPLPPFSLATSSGSAPTTRRNSFVMPGSGRRLGEPSVSFALSSSTAPGSKRDSFATPPARSFAIPPPHTPPTNMRQRERATIFQTGVTMRPPNLLTGAGNHATIRSNAATSALNQPLPLDIPHWKARSLVTCKYCFTSSLEFMQAIAERYGMDAGREEHARACKLAYAAGRAPPRPRPESKFTISIANTLFSMLLTPLWNLSSLSSNDFVTNHNPVLQDSFNVLGKVIVSPHIWPTLLACLQSNSATCSLSSTPFLKHHVLKDLNTLFIGTNQMANNRNCKLLFKYYGHVEASERMMLESEYLEKEKDKKFSEKDRDKLQRKQRRKTSSKTKIMIGSWQKGLLTLLKNHVPTRGGRYPTLKGGDPGIERLHSKIYQYTLNLFGVFHFYKFQCIGSHRTVGTNVHLGVGGHSKSSAAAAAAEEKASLLTSCADFEKLFKESFWRSMHLHKQAQQEQDKEITDAIAAAAAEKEEASKSGSHKSLSSKSGKSADARLAAAMMKSASAARVNRRSSIDIRHLDHTVARSMLTTMLQRLIFKIKSKTCNLDQRWPAIAFLIQMVKSFIFSTPLKGMVLPSSSSSTPTPTSSTMNGGSSHSGHGLSPEMLLGFPLDFVAGHETLHTTSLGDDIELIEKCLELIRSLRLYQELDLDQMSLQKQKEIKAYVEKESHTNKGRMVDINDPLSKLKLNPSHEDLSLAYSNLIPTDQVSLRFLQQQVSFLKDTVCFLSMIQSNLLSSSSSSNSTTTKVGVKNQPPPRSSHSIDKKELTHIVQQFITIERREKVFCANK